MHNAACRLVHTETCCGATRLACFGACHRHAGHWHTCVEACAPARTRVDDAHSALGLRKDRWLHAGAHSLYASLVWPSAAARHALCRVKCDTHALQRLKTVAGELLMHSCAQAWVTNLSIPRSCSSSVHAAKQGQEGSSCAIDAARCMLQNFRVWRTQV